MRETTIQIQEGEIRVNGDKGIVYGGNDLVVAIDIDLHTKYATFAGETSTEALLGSDENTIDKSGLDGFTIISFPEFPDYEIFCAEVCRYTFRVCLKRVEPE